MKALPWLEEEQHQFCMGGWISILLSEIGDGLFHYGKLQRTIAPHIQIKTLGNDGLELLNRNTLTGEAGVQKYLILYGEPLELTDYAE